LAREPSKTEYHKVARSVPPLTIPFGTKPRLIKTLLVVGPSRAGKSTFCNVLAGRNVQMEGKRNTRDGCTKNIRIIQFDRDDISDTVNYTIQIIDTIGF